MLSVAFSLTNIIGRTLKTEVGGTQEHVDIVAAGKSSESASNLASASCTTVNCSWTSLQMNRVIQSNHVKKDDILDGGKLLKWVDTCACLSAERLAGHSCVTVSVDDLYFNREVRLGHILIIKSQVNRAFNTSMEVGVKVTCEDLHDKDVKVVCDAYMTFVALDSSGKKVQLPKLITCSTEEQLNYSLAAERRKVRIGHAKTLKTLLSNYKLSPLHSPTPHDGNDAFPSTESIHGFNTRTESVELVLPPHANHHGNTFGGQVMAWMENAASISAGRLCNGIATLRSVDMVYFRGPSAVGDRIVLKSIVNNVFQNSLEVGVRVEAYRHDDGKISAPRHINSAFLTYEMPGSTCISTGTFIPENLDGVRRQREAVARRKMRLDRRYILSFRNHDQLSVPWNTANSMYLCYANITSLSRLAAKCDWDMASSNNKILLSTREEEGILSFRATLTKFDNYKAEDVFNILKDPRKRAEWDPVMISCDLVRVVGDEDVIYHSVMRSMSHDAIHPNDFIILISDRRPTSDNEPYRVAIRSVTLDEAPPMESHCRTEVACAGFVIHQKCGICTEISYFNETNPKLVSYVTCDIAGLSALHCHVFQSMQEYMRRHLATTS